MSAIFYNNEEQKKLAIEFKDRQEARTHKKIFTQILPASRFYRAEDYHQKYYLRQRPDLIRELRAIYPSDEELVNSTVAARLNGYLAEKGPYPAIKAELESCCRPRKADSYWILSGAWAVNRR